MEEIAVGRLLKAPQFFLLLISAMLGAAIITALDPTLGPHLEDILGYGPGTIGIAFAVIAGVYAAFTPFAGCVTISYIPINQEGIILCTAEVLLREHETPRSSMHALPGPLVVVGANLGSDGA